MTTSELDSSYVKLETEIDSFHPVWRSWRLYLLAMLLSFAITVPIAHLLPKYEKFPDLFSSYVGFGGINKHNDFTALYIFMACALGIYAGLLGLIQGTTRAIGGNSATLSTLLNVPLVLLAYYAGTQLVQFDQRFLPIEAWLATTAVLLYFVVARHWRVNGQKADLFLPVGLLFLWNVFLLIFGGIGLQLFLSRRFPWSTVLAAAHIGLVYSIAGIIGLLVICWRGTNYRECGRSLVRLVYLAQIPLPLLFWKLVTPGLTYRGEKAPTFHAPVLKSLLFALFFICAVLLFRQYRRRSLSLSLRAHTQPLCLAGVAVVIAISSIYPTIAEDDFHLGEQIIPWQQLVQFHSVPYVDLIPIHGLMPMFAGALNSVVFDGTIAHFYDAANLLRTVALSLTVVLMFRIGGVLPALLFCFCPAVLDRFYFLGPAVFCLVNARLLRKPLRWLTIAILVALGSVCYNVPVGAALTLAVSPIFILQGFRAWRQDADFVMRWLGGLVILICASLAVPVIRNMAFGLIQFVVENGAINEAAHGVNWQITAAPGSSGFIASSLLFQILEFLWIPLGLGMGMVLLNRWLRQREVTLTAKECLLFITVVCLVGLIPWSMGRIDPGVLSRTGSLSLYVVLAILPVILWRYNRFTGARSRRISGTWAIAVAFVAGLFSPLTNYAVSLKQITERAAPVIAVPDSLVAIDRAASRNLPNMGYLYLPPARLQDLGRFQRIVSQFVGRQGTYFDLTNRQALYAFTGRLAPTLYPPVYIAVSSEQESRILEQLHRHPPHLIFVSPGLLMGDGPPNLRSYLLYRYSMLNFRPCKVGDYVFFTDLTINRTQCEAQVPDLQVLNSLFPLWSLGHLPLEWGESWDNLQHLFEKKSEVGSISGREILHNMKRAGNQYVIGPGTFDEQDYLARNPDVAKAVQDKTVPSGLAHYLAFGKIEGRSSSAQAAIEINLRDLPVRPAHEDFLTFVITCDSGDVEVPLGLRYSSDVEPLSPPITFTGGVGRVIIPLGSYPSWLRATKAASIRLEFPNQNTRTVQLSDLAFLHYRAD